MPRFAKNEVLQFRVLYRQFLLHIVDLETLSTKADVTKLLGQFAAILVMFSLLQGLAALLFASTQMSAASRIDGSWTLEHNLISITMLTVGLFTVLGWESTFPDRRDAMVLAPLPLRFAPLFFAKVAASGTAVSLSVLLLNVASGITWPSVLAHGGLLGILRAFGAYWITMLASGAFLFCSVLTVQGVTAQLLPRRLFLRLSACLQLLAFCLFLSIYLFQPEIATPAALVAAHNQRLLAWLPTYWFLALFNQLNGTNYPALVFLARRAGTALAVAVFGAGSAFMLSYFGLLRKIVEEPDIVPGRPAPGWSPNFAASLTTAIALFSFRSLLRSRQHRVLLAFYLGIGVAIAIASFKILSTVQALSSASFHVLSLRFLISTVVMMSFAVIGIRVGFSLPVSLPSNWIFRLTEVRQACEYLTANRRSLLLLAVVPVWGATALFSVLFEPVLQSLAHLAVLWLLGVILVDLCLLNFRKIPFTCSYLPGKSNVQFLFWACVLLFIRFIEYGVRYEQRALENPMHYLVMLGVLALLAASIRLRAMWLAKSAVLKFDEVPAPEVLSLGLHRDGMLVIEIGTGRSQYLETKLR